MDFLYASAILLALDTPWLLVNQQQAARMIQDIQGSSLQVRWLPALLVYPALATLLLQASSVKQAALIGLATYAVYDLTSYALLKNYQLSFAIADTLWGAILFSLSYYILKVIRRNG